MTLKISDEVMVPEIGGEAKVTGGGRWQVSNWPEQLDRNQAITALTVTELGQGRNAKTSVAAASVSARNCSLTRWEAPPA